MKDSMSPQQPTAATELPKPFGLGTVRARACVFQKYIFWALTAAFVLLLTRVYASLIQDWVGLLRTARQILRIPDSAVGPDWLLSAGLCLAVLGPALAVFALYVLYRRHWNARLRAVWNLDDEADSC